MHAAGGCLPARRHAEFLQRIGEGERQVGVVVEVAVQRAIERVGHAGAQATRDRDRHAVIAIEVRQHLARIHRRSGQHDQIGDVATLQRKLDDLRLLDDIADARRTDVDERRRAFDGDGLLETAHGEHDVDRRHAAYLQHDAGLSVGSESLQRDVQPVGAGRQVRQHVRSIGLRDHAAGESCVGLRDGHADTGEHPAALVAHRAIELRGRLRARDAVGREQREDDHKDTTDGVLHHTLLTR